MREVTTINTKSLKFNPESIRVLIVDDQDNMRKMIKRIVNGMGMKDIIEAADGSEAIAEIEKQRIDLILCDLYMRNIQGLEVLETLRSRQLANDTPFVLITGEGSREDIVQAADKGADGYILKPFQIDEFEDKIITILNKYHTPNILLEKLRKSENFILEKLFNDAALLLKEALVLEPTSVRAKHSLAIALTMLGQSQEAIHLLEENIEASPSFYRNYATLSNIYLKERNVENAIKYLKKELELHPKQPKRQTQLANIYMKNGDHLQAINHLREALKENNKYIPALMSIGKAFSGINDMEKAIYYFQRIRRYEDNNEALNLAIKLLIDSSHYKRAELWLKDEINRYKNRVSHYIALSKLYILQERIDEAKAMLQHVLAKDPNHIDALKISGTLNLKQKEFSDAALMFKRVIAIAPNDINSLLYFAEAAEKLGKYDVCLQSLERAYKIETDNLKLNIMYGTILFKMSQFFKASHILSKARLKDGKNDLLDKYLKECRNKIALRRKNANTKAS